MVKLQKMIDSLTKIDLCVIRDDESKPPIRIQENLKTMEDICEFKHMILEKHCYVNKVSNVKYELTPNEEFNVIVNIYMASVKNKDRIKKGIKYTCTLIFCIVILLAILIGAACAIFIDNIIVSFWVSVLCSFILSVAIYPHLVNASMSLIEMEGLQ